MFAQVSNCDGMMCFDDETAWRMVTFEKSEEHICNSLQPTSFSRDEMGSDDACETGHTSSRWETISVLGVLLRADVIATGGLFARYRVGTLHYRFS